MADILGAAPFGTPYVLTSGVVGILYTSEDLSAGTNPGGIPPWVLTAPEVPLTFAISAGALPPGLAFNYSSPLAATTVPPDAPGVNIINVVGTPSTPGIYNFTLRWRTNQYPGFGTQAFANYRIEIIDAPTPPKKKRRIGAPQIVCCDPKQFPNGCPDQLRTTNGNFYQRISERCYALIRRK